MSLDKVEMFDMFKMVGMLFVIVCANVLSGIINNCVVNEQKFDVKYFKSGVLKAFTACVCLIIISLTFSVMDLSGLGFSPKTVITSGIIVYITKLLANSMKLLGLTPSGKDAEASVIENIGTGIAASVISADNKEEAVENAAKEVSNEIKVTVNDQIDKVTTQVSDTAINILHNDSDGDGESDIKENIDNAVSAVKNFTNGIPTAASSFFNKIPSFNNNSNDDGASG